MSNTDTRPNPFACDNCGHKPTAQEVISQHGDCRNCGDTVRAFTVDAAQTIATLTDRLAKAEKALQAYPDFINRAHQAEEKLESAETALREQAAQLATAKEQLREQREETLRCSRVASVMENCASDWKDRLLKTEADLATATTALARSEERVKELEEDARRLDWLMEMAQWHTPLSMIHGEIREYRFRTPCITPTINIRKAIDAARANPVGK